MTETEWQYYGGVLVLLVGILVVVVAAVAVSIKAIRDALMSINADAAQTNTFSNLAAGLNAGAIIGALLKIPTALALIVGALTIWLGLVMMNGGPWLFGLVTLDDPKPEVIAEAT